jgi:RND superfamily putative drug exporter
VLHAFGRLLAHHARWFLAGWVVIVVLGFATVGGLLGNEGLFSRLQAGDAPQVPGDSRTGQQLLERAATTGPAVQLLLDGIRPGSAPVRAAVDAAAKEVAAIPHVFAVQQPYAVPAGARTITASKITASRITDQPAKPAGKPAMSEPATVAAAVPNPFTAEDGRAVLVIAQLEKGLTRADEKAAAAAVSTRLMAVPAALPGSHGSVGGQQALIDEINGHVENDLRVGEAVALPLSLLVMIVVFGGLLAAGLPIAGAIASIAGGLFTLLGFSYLIDLDSTVPSVVSVMGLGLCIDYGLLLVSRYREELRRLHDAGDDSPSPQALEGALEHTLGTAGRTVLFSAVTVAISLSGLMFFDATILRAVGAAGVSVVVVALLVALTLVPALLAVAGDRMIRPGITHHVPLLNRFARWLGDVPPAEGAFSRLARAVQRRPLLVVLGVGTVLLLAAAPVLSIRLVNSGVQLLPADSAQRRLFEAVDQRFPLIAQAPITVVSRAPVADLARWGTEVVAGLPGVASAGPATERGSGANRIAVLDVRATAGRRGEQVDQLVGAVNAHRPAFGVFVTGADAQHVAFLDSIRSRAPLAGGLVVLATFLLLFLMTGSILVPLKALLMNVVSLGASFGVLVWVFQDGHFEKLLGFSSAGGIDTTIPALVLAFAFGLAMDYEVFLLSRIKELRDAGADNDTAVVAGLQRSGRIITSAALIVVIVFAGFAAGQLLVIKEMGVALSVAVAIDAILVRVLLVPATMTLLGEWNWWAPGPLRRLYARFGVREQ